MGDNLISRGTATRGERRTAAEILADHHGGVLSRDLLRGVGVDRHLIAREVGARRWARQGNQTVALHRRPLGEAERRWRAVWEVGAEVALVDGISALLAQGLTGIQEYAVHVSVIHNHRVPHPAGVVVHKLARRHPTESVGAGLPRTRAPIAALRAAHWAVSDRQAALVLALTVQQRLATPQALALALAGTKHRRRRACISALVADLTGGAHSLGELDFARLCRDRGIPEPERQVLRRGRRGMVYLDVRWRCGLVVEIDGSGHRRGLAVMADNLRSNAIVLEGDRVLRIDLWGLRLERNAFLDQVEHGLRMLGEPGLPPFPRPIPAM